MLDILEYVKSVFPVEWLSNLGKDCFDEFGETGVDISHPDNDEIELSILILEERVGIAVIKKKEKDILIDLGGFDYNFEKFEKEELKSFLLTFYKTGKLSKDR